MSTVSVKVDGLPELIRALRNNANLAKPFKNAFDDIGLQGSSASKKMTPVGVSGNLRRYVTFKTDTAPFPTFVRIGTVGGDKVNYAAYMEYGTGLQHDHPSWPRKPHVVPTGRRTPAGLKLWARRKGQNPFSIAGAINAKGGLKPRRYLRDPFERNKDRYVKMLANALKEARLDG